MGKKGESNVACKTFNQGWSPSALEARGNMMERRDAARVALLLLAFAGLATARPLVRNVKTDAEFKKLLKHHAEVSAPEPATCEAGARVTAAPSARAWLGRWTADGSAKNLSARALWRH